MKGFILAAGLGERLKPITEFFPKPLVPVANIPSICYAISLLASAGIRDVTINLHYRHESIRSFFEKNGGFGLELRFSYEPEILGTGGGVMKCRKHLEGGDFVLLNSDVVVDLDLSALMRRHRETKSPGTVVLYRSPQAASIGQAGVRDGKVVDFKNFLGTGTASGLVYTGAAVLSPAVFAHLEEGFSSIVYTGYTGLIRHEGLDFYEHDGLWLDVGTVPSLHAASLCLAGSALAKSAADACGLEAAPVASSAGIAGDAVINNSVIGDDCIVGAGVRISDSLLLPGAVVAAGGRISNSVVLGSEVIEA